MATLRYGSKCAPPLKVITIYDTEQGAMFYVLFPHLRTEYCAMIMCFFSYSGGKEGEWTVSEGLLN